MQFKEYLKHERKNPVQALKGKMGSNILNKAIKETLDILIQEAGNREGLNLIFFKPIAISPLRILIPINLLIYSYTIVESIGLALR